MNQEQFEKALENQPSTVDWLWANQVINNSIDKPSYGKLQLVTVMEEFAELLEMIELYRQHPYGLSLAHRIHLIEELADTLLGLRYVSNILYYDEITQYDESYIIEHSFVNHLLTAIQMISKFVRGAKNTPRKRPEHYRATLGKALQGIYDGVHSIQLKYGISNEELNKAMMVKLKRQEKRNKDTLSIA